ncbi:MAG: acyl-CoA dehydrogenase, partial [Mycolicibacterium hassiacum]|nr:acyl-CoA dehydrogenase [Mycolicibacterium hassiacum]
MTNTLPSRNGSKVKPRRGGHESAVGLRRHKRTPTDLGLALLTPLVGQEFLDRYNLRDPLNRGLKYGVKQAFSAAGAANRQFKRIAGKGEPTRLKKSGSDLFDLTPDDEQKMIVETVNQ